MINNVLRNGNFTSSEAVALLGMSKREMTEAEKEEYKKANPKGRATTITAWPGETVHTYVSECNMERSLGRSIEKDESAKPLNWGKFVEALVHGLLSTDYSLVSSDTVVNPLIPWWTGSVDGLKYIGLHKDAVTDIKCPYTLKSFCQLVDPLYNGLAGIDAMNAIRFGWVDKMGIERKKHKDGEKYFLEIVSNGCHHGTKYAELIVFVPFQCELEAIKHKALLDNQSGKNYWLSMAQDDELPYLPENSLYTNINKIRFEVTEAMKMELTLRVLQAGKMLINNPDYLQVVQRVKEEIPNIVNYMAPDQIAFFEMLEAA